MPPRTLHAAMHHAMFPGGKRLRPMLGLLGCSATGGDLERALRPSAALELLHTYSLVHDDLPCMDDDDLRRGRPTCHKVFGEAAALLAGDALLTLAFEGVAAGGAAAVATLARAAGCLGMVGGQMADLEAEGGAGERSLAAVRWIHDRKTGALITASLLVGALAGQRPGRAPLPDALRQMLGDYGDRLGRAFQIADDCLDLTGTAAELGKNPLADLAHDKLTWPAIVGLPASLRQAQELADAAVAMAPAIVFEAASWQQVPIDALDEARGLLQDAALYAVHRRS
ncbi:MAG: polyprenyl synthetase family protein [Planctomycetes bacterium]|nr:polyprenyl synthetase family protein [Planctomycetota bacterium]